MQMTMNKKNLDALAHLFFKVRKEKAESFIKDKKMTFTPNRSHFVIAETDEGPYVINSCSKTYELLTNEELILPVLEKLEERYEVQVIAKMSNYSRFYVDFLIKDHKMQLGKPREKGDIFPRIRLNNSYDGGMKYSYEFGFHRLVCTNGLSVPVKGTSMKQKMMHTPAIGHGQASSALNRTLDRIETFVDESEELLGGFKPLEKNKRSIAEATQLMQAIVEELKYPKKELEPAIARLNLEANMGFPVNDFLVYNALNHAMFHGESKMKEHKKQGMDTKVLDFLLNNAA